MSIIWCACFNIAYIHNYMHTFVDSFAWLLGSLENHWLVRDSQSPLSRSIKLSRFSFLTRPQTFRSVGRWQRSRLSRFSALFSVTVVFCFFFFFFFFYDPSYIAGTVEEISNWRLILLQETESQNEKLPTSTCSDPKTISALPLLIKCSKPHEECRLISVP